MAAPVCEGGMGADRGMQVHSEVELRLWVLYGSGEFGEEEFFRVLAGAGGDGAGEATPLRGEGGGEALIRVSHEKV